MSRRVAELTLTPQVFRRLDLIARANGYLIQVRATSDMGNAWGRVSGMAGEVYEDISSPHLRCFETSLIEITSRISVEAFLGTQRPEIDLSVIPVNKIWDYVLWHEIGHLRGNFSIWEPQLDRSFACPSEQKQWVRAHRIAIEAIADRFAWEAIGDGMPLPISATRLVSSDFLSEWIAKLDGRYQRVLGKDRPLAIEPFRCVPYQHVKHGIPYENADHREAALKELASYRRAALPVLLDEARLAGVVVEYLHGEIGDVPTPELGWQPEMQKRVSAMQRIKSELNLFCGYARDEVAATLPRVPPAWLVEHRHELPSLELSAGSSTG